MDNITWKEYFMGIAELSAKRSKDPKTKVGCCIVDPKTNHILGIGYNGLPKGFDDKEFDWEEKIQDKNPYVVHAEANAILNSFNTDLEGAEVFCTMFPCNECAKLLSQKGIKKIIYKDEKYKKKKAGIVAEKIFKKANIEIEKYI